MQVLNYKDIVEVNNVEFGLPHTYSVFTLKGYSEKCSEGWYEEQIQKGEVPVCLLPQGTMLLGPEYKRPTRPNIVLNIGDKVEIEGKVYEITKGPSHAKVNIGLVGDEGKVYRY